MPDSAIEKLAELRAEILEASEAFDWDLVATVDGDIRQLAQDFPKDNRSPALEAEFVRMKAGYDTIFSSSQLRKAELKKELGQMRDKREALEGYKNSLAAGNREIRTSA